MGFLTIFIITPLALLLVGWLLLSYPVRMAVLVFLIGPLVGSCVLVTIGEFSKSNPSLIRIAAAVPFFFFLYAVPIFGLWVATAGIAEWAVLQRIPHVPKLTLPFRLLAASGIGAIGGIILIFAFYAFLSFSAALPYSETIGQISHERVALLSVAMQGMIAGAVCGVAVGWHLR
jgi:hypothetical protein